MADAELAANLDQPRQQVLDHDRSKAKRELIDQQQLRRADNGARQRQHLPFAAGKKPADAMRRASSWGKKLEHQRFALAPLGGSHGARERRSRDSRPR